MRGKRVFDLLRELIREEIGRNFHTLHPEPHTFEDFSDYDIEINGNTLDGFYLTIRFIPSKQTIFPTCFFQDETEARHKSRMVIDQHRVQFMNGGKI
jgi:hypothetical protein